MEARKEVWGGTEQANIGASQQREADGAMRALHWRHARHRHLRPQRVHTI